MALSALTLSVITGIQGRAFKSAVNGRTAGTIIEVTDGATPGVGYVNGFATHNGLPYDLNVVELRERVQVTGESRVTRVLVTAVTEYAVKAQALASTAMVRGFRSAGVVQADGSLVYSLFVEDVLGSTAVLAVGAGGGVVVPPVVLQRLAFSQPVTKGVTVPAGTTVLNRAAGSTLATTIPGLAISATGVVSGTPTGYSGLVTETRADGTTRDTILFTPRTTQSKMRMWMGTSGIAYYFQNRVWIDYMKVSDWLTAPATVDANGMPLTLKLDNNNQYGASANIWVDAGTVKWHVVTDGDMDLPGWTAEAGGYTKTTTRQTGGADLLVITRISASKPPTKFALVRDDELARFNSGKITRPGYVADCAKFDGIRTMNWNGGQFDNPIPNKINALSYSKGGAIGGVPLDAICQVIREVSSAFGLWFNVHVDLTTAQFVSDYLPALKSLRADGHRVKLEYSNEISFNYGFGQWGKALANARAAGVMDANSPNYDSQANDYTLASWWLGKRTAELGKAVRGTGIEPTVGVQTVLQTYYLTFLKRGMAQTPDFSISECLWHISFYSGGPLCENAAPADLRAKMDALIAANNTDAIWDLVANYTGPMATGGRNSMESNRSYWNEGAQIVAANNMKGLGAYEGSLDFIVGQLGYGSARATAYNAVLYPIQADANAQGAAYQLLQTIDDCGLADACAYDDDSDPGNTYDGRYGSKGLPARVTYDGWNAAAAPAPVLPPVAPTGRTVGRVQLTVEEAADSGNRTFVVRINDVYGIDASGAIVRPTSVMSYRSDYSPHTTIRPLPEAMDGNDHTYSESPGIYEVGSIPVTITFNPPVNLKTFAFQPQQVGTAPGKWHADISPNVDGSNATLRFIDLNEADASKWTDYTSRLFPLA